MSEHDADTEVAANSDTVAADSQPSAPRIRASGPVRPPAAGGADYADLTEVDPAHYVLIRELARGGMGRIQLAHDRRLGRDVAVKEVLANTGVIVRRFEREARITARLQHPSIVAVHEAGRWPSGEPFYAMRLVAGRSLDEAIAATKSFDERIALVPSVLAVADAMAYAHGQRVIHRDLKPRNVLVGEFGETVVIDWGLAKELGSVDISGDSHPSQSGPGETTAGDVLGTPAYMPPEQAAGAAVDPRADVYAIGAILYHLLAGRAPYVAESSAELLSAVHTGPPQPVTERAPATPAELVAIVDRAMARDPAARYPSAKELAEDLRRFQTGQLVGAHRYSLRQLLGRWARRHRTALIATGAAAIAAIVIGVFALRRIEQQRAVAIDNQKRAEELMQFMVGDLRGKLAHFGRVDLLDTVAKRAVAYYAARGTASAEDERLATRAQELLGEVLESRSDYAGARTAYEEAERSANDLLRRHPDSVDDARIAANTQNALSGVIEYAGDLPAALVHSRRGIEIADQAVTRAPQDAELLDIAATSHLQTARVLEAQGSHDAAIAEMRSAEDLANRERALADTLEVQKMLLNIHATRGKLIENSGKDDAAALADFRAALVLGEGLLAKDPRAGAWLQDVAISHDEVGTMLESLGDHEGAVAEQKKAAELADRLSGFDPDNYDWMYTRNTAHEHLGMLLYDANDFAGARAEYQMCLDMDRALVARDPTNSSAQRALSVGLVKLGDVAYRQRDANGAIAYIRESVPIREQLVAKDPTNMQWQRDLYYGYLKLGAAIGAIDGREAEAVTVLERGLAVAEVMVKREPDNESHARDLAFIHFNIAMIQISVKQPAPAREHLQAAEEMARKYPGNKNWAALKSQIDDALSKLQ